MTENSLKEIVFSSAFHDWMAQAQRTEGASYCRQTRCQRQSNDRAVPVVGICETEDNGHHYGTEGLSGETRGGQHAACTA